MLPSGPTANNPLARRLSQSARCSTLRRMHDLARRFLFLLCAVAFFTGATIGLAMHGASAGESCLEHQANDGYAGHHHDGDGKGNCLTCCMGVCVAIPDLPPRFFSAIAPLTAAKVAYWNRGSGIAGRTIPPDPIPPRRIA
jgi:hypothetical protein